MDMKKSKIGRSKHSLVTAEQRELIHQLIRGVTVPLEVTNHWNIAAKYLNELKGPKKTGLGWRQWYTIYCRRERISEKHERNAVPKEAVKKVRNKRFRNVTNHRSDNKMILNDISSVTKDIEIAKSSGSVPQESEITPPSLQDLVATLQDIKSNNVLSDLRVATIHKLNNLLYADDNHNRLLSSSRMSITDWLLFDTVIVHQNIDLIHVNNSTNDHPVLVHLFQLVNKYNIECFEGDCLAEAWAALTLDYNKYGRMCTPMLLQRRWYQLKVATRERFFQYQKALNTPGVDSEVRESLKPTPLQIKIANQHKWLLIRPFKTWEELIEEKLVILRDQFESIAMSKRKQQVTNKGTPSNLELRPAVDISSKSRETDQQLKPMEFEAVTIPETNKDMYINENTQEDDFGRQANSAINILPNDTLIDIEDQLPYNTIPIKCDAESALPKIINIFGNVQVPIEKLPQIGELAEKMVENNASIVENGLINVISFNEHDKQDTEHYIKNEPIDTINDNCQMDAEEIEYNNGDQIAEVIPENCIKLTMVDEKLLMVPRVETVKLDDMGILPIHCLNHVNDKTIIELIDTKSKLVKKKITANVNSKNVTDLNNVHKSVTKYIYAALNNETVVDPTNVEMTKNIKSDVSNKTTVNLINVESKTVTRHLNVDVNYKTKLGNVKTEPVMTTGNTTAGNETVIDVTDFESNQVTKNINADGVCNKIAIVLNKVKGCELINYIDVEDTDKTVVDLLSDEIKPEVKGSVASVPELIKANYTPTVKLKDINTLRISNNLFKKPRIKQYDRKQLAKNPDFNISLRKKIVSSNCNQMWLRFCKPVTINVSKSFEKKLVNGKLNVKSCENDDNMLSKRISVVTVAQNVLNETIDNKSTETLFNLIPTISISHNLFETQHPSETIDLTDEPYLSESIVSTDTPLLSNDIVCNDTPHLSESNNTDTPIETVDLTDNYTISGTISKPYTLSNQNLLVNQQANSTLTPDQERFLLEHPGYYIPSDLLYYFDDKSNINSTLESETVENLLSLLSSNLYDNDCATNNNNVSTVVSVRCVASQNNNDSNIMQCWAQAKLQSLKLGQPFSIPHRCSKNCYCCCKKQLAMYCIRKQPKAEYETSRRKNYSLVRGVVEHDVKYVYDQVAKRSRRISKFSTPFKEPGNITDILEQCLDPSLDKYIFLGNNKILFTTIKVPKNFTKFRNFVHYVNKTFAVPKGAQFILKRNGEVALVSCRNDYKMMGKLRKLVDNFNQSKLSNDVVDTMRNECVTKPTMGTKQCFTEDNEIVSVNRNFENINTQLTSRLDKLPKQIIARRIEKCLGNLLSKTLTPIKLLSELKYAYSQNGVFFKLDLEKESLVPINVYLKENLPKIKKTYSVPKAQTLPEDSSSIADPIVTKSACSVSNANVSTVDAETCTSPSFKKEPADDEGDDAENIYDNSAMDNDDNMETFTVFYHKPGNVSIKQEPQ